MRGQKERRAPDFWVLPLVAQGPFVSANTLLKRTGIPVRVAERWRNERRAITRDLKRRVREDTN